MLKGKNALVTGATSGIGQGIATALARAGVNVVLNGLGERAANEALSSDLAERYGVRTLYSDADLRQPYAIEVLTAQALQTFGRIDILVNNAGIQHVAPIEQFPSDKWNDILAVHLTASFHTIRLLAPAMREGGWGRIINMGSAHALIASPFKTAYVAAKHGLLGLTKSCALELAQSGVTVNAICPGYVLTPLVERQIPDTMAARKLTREQVERDVLLAAQPTKRFVTVDEVAELALFLCSPAAQSITGAALPIDGGWTAQ